MGGPPRDMGRAGRQLEVRLPLADGPLRHRLRHRVRLRGPVPGGVDGARGAGAGDVPCAHRHPRHRATPTGTPRSSRRWRRPSTTSLMAGSSSASGLRWHTYEHEAFGLPFHTTAERLDRLDEAVQVIKLLWMEPTAVLPRPLLRAQRAAVQPAERPDTASADPHRRRRRKEDAAHSSPSTPTRRTCRGRPRR